LYLNNTVTFIKHKKPVNIENLKEGACSILEEGKVKPIPLPIKNDCFLY